ncbi:MAG: HAD family hydrolase, partial [Gemmataceae bacterium]
MAARPVLLFDMDDTLYPELDYMKSGARHALAQLGLGSSAPAFESAMLRRFRDGQRTHLIQDAFSDIGIEARPELTGAFLSAYRGHTPEIALSPALRNALDRLLSHRVEMAVVSDGDAE